jgi:hypothetical protein
MLRLISSLAALLLFANTVASPAPPWGFHAHIKINRLAVFTLPSDMFGFYKKHIDFVSDHAVDPDKRRYSVRGEAPRHYIDVDHYCEEPGCDPFEEVPRRWNDAVEKFSQDTLEAYGIVPWHINTMVYRLTDAFKEENLDRILRYSAEIGHYIGDAHVPLHTTENYNGQLSDQKGIHGFWESRIPELFDLQYDFFVGKAKYLERPLDFAWDVVTVSHHAVDSVLGFEAELNENFPEDRKYGYVERGVAIVHTYSEEYSKAYSDMLNGQVERRMRDAVVAIGSAWYTAWVNAGQPDLDKLAGLEVSPELVDEISKEATQPVLPDLKKREHDN